MILKFTSNNDFDFQCESVSLLKDFGKDLVKRASSKDLFKGSYDKNPDQEDLHIIAVGAYEGTGYNRNGDAFSEYDCKKNHHYFTDAGRAVHRHHKNKPSDPKYGNIKAAAYNDKMRRIELIVGLDKKSCADILNEQENTGNTNWSMACFPAGTLVKLSSGIEKEIDKIEINDEVITHTGKIGKVTNKFSKYYNDLAIKFKAVGTSEAVFCTKNHPVWARVKPTKNSPCPVCGQSFASLKSHLRQKLDVKHQYALNNLDKMYEGWVAAENLKVGDYVTTPFDKSISNDGASESYAKLLGWYLAEGHYYESPNVKVSNHCLDFTLNINENDYANEIVQLLKANGVLDKHIKIYEYQKHHKQVVRCRDLSMAKQLVIDGGKYSHGKKLSKRVLQWQPSIQKHIIEKWLEGDGTLNRADSSCLGVTVSRMLMYDICTLAYRNGLIPLVSKHVGLHKPSYTITFTANETNQLDIAKKAGFKPTQFKFNLGKLQDWQSGKIITKVNCCKKLAYIEGNKVYKRIRKINRELLSAEVYDITVPGDCSFTVSNIAVHNSKQAEDICSRCGHHAKTDKDRCKHIPDNIGEIDDTGEMCGMLNPDPHWFEISNVRRPADRIGMSLGKMASALATPMTTADYLSLYGDLYIPDDLLLSKKAEDKRALLTKFSELEKHVEAISNGKPITCKDKFIKEHGPKLKHTPKIDDISMDSLRSMEPSLVLKTLADNGIVFSPEDFSSYLFGKRVKADRIEGMKSHLPHAFQNADKDGGSIVNNERFDPSSIGHIPEELKKLVSGLTEGHSLKDGPATRRIMMICISGSPMHEEPTKKAADKFLAEQYLSYKLAQAQYMQDNGKLTDDIMLNMVLQNG